jgi:acetylornithine deacetylase/succinyl-diaminopimelate desuccinylase-like protein
MAAATVELLQRSGVTNARTVDVPRGYPMVYGEVLRSPELPTVLLYAHYDVQPAPLEQGWTVDPWQPVERDGRLYGRGAADDKSGIAMHAATLQVLRGELPVNVKLVIEGEEETHSHLEDFVAASPELFTADVCVIADGGNDRVGNPLVCTALRGVASCNVEVRTLAQAVHSGMYGGAVPDALMALIRILASLHDEKGNTAIEGLVSGPWDGAELEEEQVRGMAGVRPGVELIGDGSINSRLVSKPAATVIGIDAPSVDGAVNALSPVARATVSLRIPPGADAEAELAKLSAHLRAVAPWAVELTIDEGRLGAAFSTPSDGPALTAALGAMESAYGVPAGITGSGGSIPLLNALQQVNPKAEFIVWGAEDAERANIHSADESVDLGELEAAALAQAIFLRRLADVKVAT